MHTALTVNEKQRTLLYSELFDTGRTGESADPIDRGAGEGLLKALLLVEDQCTLSMLHAVDSPLVTLAYESEEEEFAAILSLVRKGAIRFTTAVNARTPLQALTARLTNESFIFSTFDRLNSNLDLRRLALAGLAGRPIRTDDDQVDAWVERIRELSASVTIAQRRGLAGRQHGPRTLGEKLSRAVRNNKYVAEVKDDLDPTLHVGLDKALDVMRNINETALNNRSHLYALFGITGQASDIPLEIRSMLKDRFIDREYTASMAAEIGAEVMHDVFDAPDEVDPPQSLVQGNIMLTAGKEFRPLTWKEVGKIKSRAQGDEDETVELVAQAIADGIAVKRSGGAGLAHKAVNALASDNLRLTLPDALIAGSSLVVITQGVLIPALAFGTAVLGEATRRVTVRVRELQRTRKKLSTERIMRAFVDRVKSYER